VGGAATPRAVAEQVGAEQVVAAVAVAVADEVREAVPLVRAVRRATHFLVLSFR
jgi:hypothetical protein